jgi:hypothetical protein
LNLLLQKTKKEGMEVGLVKLTIVLPLTLFDAAIITANNGRIIATVCHKVENSGANQSLAR